MGLRQEEAAVTQPAEARTPNICQTCGKRKGSFVSRAEARRVARITRGRRLRVYPCGPYFHLTSVPADRISTIRSATGKAAP